MDLEIKQRKRRQTMNKEILKRLRKDIDKDIPFKSIADSEEISIQTVYNMAKKIQDGLSDEEILCHKKGRKKIDNVEVKNKLSHTLLKDPSFTQNELASELRKSQTSICRILKEMNYTRKRLVKVPEERNNEKNMNARQTYAREIQFIHNENLVFLDETGLNLNQTRNYGYSPKNVKAYVVAKGNRGKNISCMVAIKNSGIVAFEIKDGAFEGTSFIHFLNDKLLEHFQANPHDILIMDNCRFHHRKDVLEFLNQNSILFRFLPPYSPQLNPIEEYFSHFKSVLQGIHPLPTDRGELKNRISNALRNETIDCNGWFAHMRSYVEKALAKHDFV